MHSFRWGVDEGCGKDCDAHRILMSRRSFREVDYESVSYSRNKSGKAVQDDAFLLREPSS